MTFESWLMLGILIVMFGFLVWNKLPAWIVFVGALAVTMTLLGDVEAAIDQLELLLSTPSFFSREYLRRDPVFDPVRENPRYQALLTNS